MTPFLAICMLGVRKDFSLWKYMTFIWPYLTNLYWNIWLSKFYSNKFQDADYQYKTEETLSQKIMKHKLIKLSVLSLMKFNTSEAYTIVAGSFFSKVVVRTCLSVCPSVVSSDFVFLFLRKLFDVWSWNFAHSFISTFFNASSNMGCEWSEMRRSLLAI